jgi:hypothetical protein
MISGNYRVRLQYGNYEGLFSGNAKAPSVQEVRLISPFNQQTGASRSQKAKIQSYCEPLDYIARRNYLKLEIIDSKDNTSIGHINLNSIEKGKFTRRMVKLNNEAIKKENGVAFEFASVQIMFYL